MRDVQQQDVVHGLVLRDHDVLFLVHFESWWVVVFVL